MIAIIGGGMTGLTAAIRLAERGFEVDLFEAAPGLGGRTRSFFDKAAGQLCDNGPHLMIGAYHATRRLLRDCGADRFVHWQQRLALPLWDRRRRHLCLRPTPLLPLPMAMLAALTTFPGHGYDSALAIIRLMRSRIPGEPSLARWMDEQRIPHALRRDFLTPLCIGVMNEAPESAPARTFQRVLKEAFAKHETARLGWFTRPLSTALIEPLATRAQALGVRIHRSTRIREVRRSDGAIRLDRRRERFQRIILATPARTDIHIHGWRKPSMHIATNPITTLHLFYDQPLRLGADQPLLGGIGTLGQWFFDVSAQMEQASELQHIAVVISAESIDIRSSHWRKQILEELTEISGQPHARYPVHSRVVQEKHATVLTRPEHSPRISPPGWLIDARERPRPGELPATIEAAVRRGERAALSVSLGV